VVAEANVADAAAVTAPPVEPELKLDLDGVKTGIKDWLADTPPPVSEPAPAVQEAPAPPEAEAEPDIPDIKLDHIDLSFDEAPKSEVPKQEEAAKDDRWYDVQTKFDLAKAYQEMGDKEGAREILEEVMKEGDAGQQVEAKQMLAALA
jgi:pilus assembly protein FimV